jgi:hypothetical protein
LEAATVLEGYSDPINAASEILISQMEARLQRQVKSGGVKIDPYPASAYLTQLVVRVLRRRGKLTEDLEESVNNWAWAELTRQLALIQAKSKMADPFAIAYLLMLVPSVTPKTKTDPELTNIQRTALKTFFDNQREDGTWPLSRPLFHYEKFGNAHCYEYEMLTQLLQQVELQDLLLSYLKNLNLAAQAVASTVYRVEDGVQAWTSGHHPQLGDPESWTTASVYHFVHCLDRLLAEAVRRTLFGQLESPLSTPVSTAKTKENFAVKLLDSELRIHSGTRSLKDFLWDDFVKPLVAESGRIASGRPFEKNTPRSAILFGPPGTSKTELSKMIAAFLGWPFLSIDPSLLLRNGMEGIQAEANTIFRMLEETEGVVVLFDEFDELVRERGSAEAAPFSRLLTTAMLPKLASIHARGTLVYIIATNNIGEFDLAIRRPGRFDRIVQVMPPTFDAKMGKIDWGPAKLDFQKKLTDLGFEVNEDFKRMLGDLTYGECEEFAARLTNVTDRQHVLSVLNDRWKGCALETKVPEQSETWRDRCSAEEKFNN